MDLTLRKIILEIVEDILVEQAYSNIALDKRLKENENDLSQKQKALVTQIVYGIITYQLRIDNIIAYISNIKFNKIEMKVRNILRIAIYQLIYLDNVKPNVVVNESTELTKSESNEGSAKFTNAILRRMISGKYEEYCEYESSLKKQDKIKYISSITSHPLWMVRKLLEEYDEEFVLNLLKANNEANGYYIRINTLISNTNEVLKYFEDNNIKYSKGCIEEYIKVEEGNILNTELFKNGKIVLQDIAPGIACKLLDPKEGQNILDACSSPGGKTAYIAMLVNDHANIDAWDIHEHRVELVNQTLKKLQITCANARLNDATIYEEKYSEKYDKIILDVPCSGFGVIRKKGDIKQKRKPENIIELCALQKEILETNSKYLKLGGRLIYSTCTVLKEENEDIVNEFLENNKEFKLVDANKELAKNNICIKNYEGKDNYIRLYPSVNDCDGFFIGIIERIK